MAGTTLGLVIAAPDSAPALKDIKAAEDTGIPAAWMTTAGAGVDAITIFAAASVNTERILLGTSITPAFSRHPISVVQQAQVLAQLAPGRFRLGLGPSNRAVMADTFGLDFRSPLAQFREYIRVAKALLQLGKADVTGQYYSAHAQLASPVDMPVMASALSPGAFEMCGAESDGAISWVCPRAYLKDVAVPAIAKGAQGAARPAPPLVAHVPVSVHDNQGEVRDAVRQQLGFFPKAPFYQRMFTAAGFPETDKGEWSDRMIDAVAISGDEDQVTHGLKELATFAGEIMVSLVAAGADKEASRERTSRLLSEIAPELARA